MFGLFNFFSVFIFYPLAFSIHQTETFSALLAFCVGKFTVTGEFPAKGQWRGDLMFSLICPWINGWVNKGEAGDWRRHRAHYGVTIMGQVAIQPHDLTSSHGNAFRITGSLWGVTASHQWIPLTKGQWHRVLIFFLTPASMSWWPNSRVSLLHVHNRLFQTGNHKGDSCSLMNKRTSSCYNKLQWTHSWVTNEFVLGHDSS